MSWQKYLVGIAILIIVLIIYRIIFTRSYKAIDNKAYVRHWIFGKWVEVQKHLEEEHKEDL